MSNQYGRIFNFSAGPGTLPEPVLERARDEMMNWHESGMGVMEMSHRGKAFMSIAAETDADARKLLSIPDNYKILYLQGGASTQFTMLAKGFLRRTADYIVTGTWGQKAVEAARLEGDVNVVFDAKMSNYDHCPDLSSLNYSSDSDYVHMTLNETIQGVDFMADPQISKPVICDMSSNIGSRPIDFSRYAMVYAGAQKNLGPAGLALVIIDEEFLAKAKTELPPMLSYQLQAENDSMYNTPPTWSIYMCGLVFKHWLSQGGIGSVTANNEEKAGLIYDAIDNSGGFFKGHAKKANRSRMNIAFTLADDALTDNFIAEAKAQGMVDLKGHRSVGGCRASVYNAFPIEGCRALAQFMGEFAQKNG